MKANRIISGVLALSLMVGSVSIPTKVAALDNKLVANNLRCNIVDVNTESIDVNFAFTSKTCNILGTKHPDTIGTYSKDKEMAETQIKNNNFTIENPDNAELDLLRDEVSFYNLDYSQKLIVDKSSCKYNLTEDENGETVGVDDWFYVKPKSGNSITVQYTKLDNNSVNYKGVTITGDNWKDNAIPLLGESGEIKFKISSIETSFTYSYNLVSSEDIKEKYQPKVMRGNVGDTIDIKTLFSNYSNIKIEDDSAYFYDGKSSILGCVDLEPYSSKIDCTNNTVKISEYGRYYVPVKINKSISTYVLIYTNNIRPIVSIVTSNAGGIDTNYTGQILKGVQTYSISSSSTMNAYSLGEDLGFHKHIYKVEDYYDYSEVNLKTSDDVATFEYPVVDNASLRVGRDTSLSLSGVNSIKVVYNNSAPVITVDNINKQVKVSGGVTPLKSVEVFDLNAKSIFKENINVTEKVYKYSDILKGKLDGSYVIEVKSSNGKSNTDVLTIDTVACTVNFENGAIYGREFTIVFKDSAITDGIRSILRDTDGELKKDKAYGSIFEYLETEEGKHTYKVTDSIGNVKIFTLYIDFTAPKPGLSKDSKGNYKYTYSGSSKKFTATDNMGIVSIEIDGKSKNVDNKKSYQYNLSGYGSHNVKLTDKAGNKSSFTVTLLPDTSSAPNVSVKVEKKKYSKNKKTGKKTLYWKKYGITVKDLKKVEKGFVYEIKYKFKYKTKSGYKAGQTKTVTVNNATSKKIKIKVFNKARRLKIGKSNKNLVLWNKTHKVYNRVVVQYRIRTTGGKVGSWSKGTEKSLK